MHPLVDFQEAGYSRLAQVNGFLITGDTREALSGPAESMTLECICHCNNPLPSPCLCFHGPALPSCVVHSCACSIHAPHTPNTANTAGF